MNHEKISVLAKLLELIKLLETFKEAVTELRAPCIESSTIGNDCKAILQRNREDYFPAMQQHIIALQAKASARPQGQASVPVTVQPVLLLHFSVAGHLEGSSNGPS